MEVTFGVAGVDAAESVPRTDAADGFSAVATDQIAVGGCAWTAVVPVYVMNIQTDTVGDDWFSRRRVLHSVGSAELCGYDLLG